MFSVRAADAGESAAGVPAHYFRVQRAGRRRRATGDAGRHARADGARSRVRGGHRVGAAPFPLPLPVRARPQALDVLAANTSSESTDNAPVQNLRATRTLQRSPSPLPFSSTRRLLPSRGLLISSSA